MDGVQGVTEAQIVRESAIRRRRRWTTREKARIVREARRPGARLQEVAQRHGLHPSLLTRWRTQHRTTKKKTARRDVRLLSVRVEPRTQPGLQVVRLDRKRASTPTAGAIEVECSAGCRIHIQGIVDPQTLRTVLQELVRSC